MQCAHDMQMVLSVFLGFWGSIAFTGHCFIHILHWLHLLFVAGVSGIGFTALYGRFPLTSNGFGLGVVSSMFFMLFVPNSLAFKRSDLFGRPVATFVNIECCAIKAAADITQKPLFSTISFSSISASSKSLFP